ncbi:MAG: condensation domain-containing protein [Anaerolineae bacterium]
MQLQRVRQVALDAYAHQDVPFEMLVQAVQPQRNLSHTPLFQVAFSLQNVPMQPINLSGISWTPLPAETGTSQFDMLLEMGERDGGLHGSLKYNTDLFAPERIRRMIGHFETLLTAVVDDPERQ